MVDRRAFLAGIAAASLPRLTWADVGSPAFLSAARQGDGYVLQGLSATAQSLFQLPLPARGHAAAAHPSRPLAVAFARRPGTYALVIDCWDGSIRQRLTPPEGRQFNGHGAFSLDGSLLMTSEVVAEGSQGRIGLWETAGYRRIGEWDSGGIGPHEIKRLADGRLVVANGGIQTDPTDRTKLNLADMRPNLSLLSEEGELVDQMELAAEYHQNSIRHLALFPGGVAFAMQWQGGIAEHVPLLGLWSPGAPAQLCEAPLPDTIAMKGYAGSIAARGDGARIAITSAPGGIVMLFDAEGTHVKSHHRADLCGVAAGESDFVATDGLGAAWIADDHRLTLLDQQQGLAWDNHLVSII